MITTFEIKTQDDASNILGHFANMGHYKKIPLTIELFDSLLSECKKNDFMIKEKVLEKLKQRLKNSLPIKEPKIKNNKVEEEIKYMNCYQFKYKNSIQRNIEFKLTFTQFKKLLKTKTCFYTGKPLIHSFGVNDKPFNHVSLERLDSTKGYTKENTVAVCYGLNQLRAKLELETHSHKFQLIDVLNMVTKIMQFENN